MLTDVAVPTSGSATLTQGFRVQWLPETLTTRPPAYSGNPGYLSGHPVLVSAT